MKDWRSYLIRPPRDVETFRKLKDDKEFLSWLGGFIDGEGTFCIQFTPKKGIVLIFCLVNADNEIVEYIHHKIGLGRLYNQKNPGSDKYKLLSRLQITRQQELLLFLPLIIPYLKVKQKEAKRMHGFLLKWQESKSKKERRELIREFDLIK